MQKLLFITTNLFGSGGVSRVLSVRLDYLIKKYNYTIHVVTTNNLRSQPFYTFNKNIVFHDITVGFKIGKIGVYKKQLKSIIEKVDSNIIINCDNGLKGALLPYLVTTKVPLIYERHCSRKIKADTFFEVFKNRLANVILSRSVKKYSAFVVLNEEEKKSWLYKNTVVIPNPLWCKNPTKSVDTSKKIALAVGRQSHEKGYDSLLEIWSMVVKKYPQWILKVYGKKDSKLNLENIVKKLGIQQNIEFYEPEKDIENVYLSGCMLLNTSISEAFGLSIIEGMFYGLTTIAFKNASGPKSIIEDNYNGFLIENGDLSAFSNKIFFLIENKNELERMSRNAMSSIKKYNSDLIINQWSQVYQSIG